MRPFDTAGLVRRVRRTADISQRELAERCGLSKAAVGRMEAGGPIATHVLVRVLAEAGLCLQVVDGSGRAVDPMRPDPVRDRAGRFLPAHLDPRPITFWWNRAPFRQRDHDRGPPNARYGRRPGGRPRPDLRQDMAWDDHPTPAELVEMRRRAKPWE
jgi:HTH-type transcriptional regulator/antitoxin HipB